jgi:putative copper export protein/cytochrome c oxidase assembly factor CtaG
MKSPRSVIEHRSMTVPSSVRQALVAGREPEMRPARWSVAALAVVASVLGLVAALLLAGGSPQPAPVGLPSSGPVTGWGVRGTRLLTDLVALVATGLLLVEAVLAASGSSARSNVRVAGAWVLAWSVSLGALLLLTAADIVGVPVHRLDVATLQETTGTERIRGLACSVVVLAALGLLSLRVRTVRGARLLLAGVLLGSLPAYVTGHATSAPDTRLAVAGVVVHVVSALIWTGGLVALAWPLRRHPALATAASRYSTVALACYVALAVSGTVTAVLRIGLSPESWSSGYGGVVIAKLTLLACLGVVGHRHRRRTLPLLTQGRPRAFLRLARVEVCLMGLGFGLAAALGNTPPPTGSTSAHTVASGPLPFPTEPFAWWRLLTEWRPDMAAIAAVAASVALTFHSPTFHRPTQRGRLLAGLAVVVVATCSGLSTYAPSLLSVGVAQLLLVLVVAPAVLAPALPLDALPTRAVADETRRFRVPPVAAAALATALVLGLYRTPLLEASLRSTWVSTGVLLVAFACGLALALAAFDARRPLGDRLVAALPVAAGLGLVAVELAAADRLVAVAWFVSVRPDADLAADQRIAALLLGAGAVALLIGATRQPQGHSRTTTRPSSALPGTAP